jgi:Zn-dependent protease
LNQGVPAGRVWGIEIAIHPLLFLLVIYELIQAVFFHDGGIIQPQENALEAVMWTGAFAIILFLSVLLHELGHCWGAALVGGRGERILLWPLGGLATLSGPERSPYHEFIVTALGPAVSLVLAMAAAFVQAIMPEGIAAFSLGRGFITLLEGVMRINAMLFLFNVLLPVFPMDCARLIRSALSMKFSPERVTYDLCLAGGLLAPVLVIVCMAFQGSGFMPGTFNVILIFIALMGMQSCFAQMREVQHSNVYTSHFIQYPFWVGVFKALQIPDHASARPPRRASSVKPRRQRASSRTKAQVIDMPVTRERLIAELDDAIHEEDFIRAAELRDQIKALETEESRKS